jgi:hypothetical protein
VEKTKDVVQQKKQKKDKKGDKKGDKSVTKESAVEKEDREKTEESVEELVVEYVEEKHSSFVFAHKIDEPYRVSEEMSAFATVLDETKGDASNNTKGEVSNKTKGEVSNSPKEGNSDESTPPKKSGKKTTNKS